jgi:hypothetical protein
MYRFIKILIIAVGWIFWNTTAIAQNAMLPRCEPDTDCVIGEFVYDDDGHTPVITDNYCQITITNPVDSVIVNGVNMADKNDGWHYYTANVASPNGLYRVSMCCDADAAQQCIDKSFVLGTSLDTVATKTDIAGIAASVWSYGTRALNSFDTLISEIWSASTRRLTDYGNNITAADVWNVFSSSLTTAGSIGSQLSTNIDSSVSSRAAQASVDAVRTSQQEQWTVYLSDVTDVSKGETYRAKLFVLNYESSPADLVSSPAISIYDPVRNKTVENVSMTKISEGVYEYVYNVASSAVQGLWETEVSATVESGKIIKRSDYWNVAGSPAQVLINSLRDTVIPGISANVTISNEGVAGYEYRYEWCVVNSQENACGGNDDTFYSSAAKFIQPGQDWATDLAATVPLAGNYYFKVMVYFGTDKSGASQSFSATAASSDVADTGGGGGSSTAGQSIIQNIEKGLSSASQLVCNQNTFPCNIIFKILARLDKNEKNTLVLQNEFASLNASVNRLLNAAPRQVTVRSNPITKYVAPAPKKKANIRLDI